MSSTLFLRKKIEIYINSYKATYPLVQQLKVAFDNRNFEAYNTLIYQKHSDVPHYSNGHLEA